MLVAAISYSLLSLVAGNLIGVFFANSPIIYLFFPIGLFALNALLFFPDTWKYSVWANLLWITAYAFIEPLAPYAGVITTVIVVIATCAILVKVKKAILRYLHTASGRALPTWGKIALYLL